MRLVSTAEIAPPFIKLINTKYPSTVVTIVILSMNATKIKPAMTWPSVEKIGQQSKIASCQNQQSWQHISSKFDKCSNRRKEKTATIPHNWLEASAISLPLTLCERRIGDVSFRTVYEKQARAGSGQILNIQSETNEKWSSVKLALIEDYVDILETKFSFFFAFVFLAVFLWRRHEHP